MKYLYICLLLVVFYGTVSTEETTINSQLMSVLKARNIGPALTSGRISDIAINPQNKNEWYIAVAAGHIWKTTNAGSSFKPVFDNEGSFSIGCLAIDPKNPFVIWAGTGENNSQRSVSWGDGIYKSNDGGKSWQNMGLKKSEHIGKILINSKNSNIVYVASQGPLWADGGERGLYKTTDGGKTWENILNISDKTGITDIAFDPRDEDIIYAASYQRRRHQWTLINGGPESAIYKSENGGKTWNKLSSGLPSGDVGRIGLAVSPVNPDYIYAIIEANESNGGFYRSTDRGASWSKQNNYVSESPQYYQEIYCDPVIVDKVYSMGTYSRLTIDGGKNWSIISNKMRHVDDHCLWVDPENTNHILIGGDGGLYETFDNAENWRFFENLPVTQFYRIQADNSTPFYWVYGGTQDNNSVGGPSRTINKAGILNMDWIYVVGGDGYEPQIDPLNPNIIYAQWQYGNFVRFDNKGGEITGIQPQPEENEELRWNWDSPLIISNFSNKRLYVAANKVFRSDDMGNSWVKISEDLTRQINRDELEIMGKIQEPEAVAKNQSTSLYGNIISLNESPLDEKVIYVGTDDGLVQVTEDGGQTWRKIEKFNTIPEFTYISDIQASRHSSDILYASFNNHKKADFKPYILKSDNRGRSWISISGNLPLNEPIWTIEEDPINPDILFVGTEYGVYFTVDGGKMWNKFTSGLPKALAVRDLDIQERENDLVIGTFSRGIYIIDDYSPLRELANNPSILNMNTYVFKIKDALMYNPSNTNCRFNEGESFFMAENPEYGAIFTYYIKDDFKSKKALRQEKWKQNIEQNQKPLYPSFNELTEEDIEIAPYLIFTIMNKDGEVIRKLKANYSKGLHRIAWDFRYAGFMPQSDMNINSNTGLPVPPGVYKVSISKVEGGVVTKLTEPKEFICKPLGNLSLPAADSRNLDVFRKDLVRLYGKLEGVNNSLTEATTNIDKIIYTLLQNPISENKLIEEAYKIKRQLFDIQIKLTGNNSISKRAGNQTMPIYERIQYIVWMTWETGSEPTLTQKNSFNIALNNLEKITNELSDIIGNKISDLNRNLDKYGAPWTPGRFPKND